MSNMRYVLTGQTISPWELPEVAHDKITNDLDLRYGIGRSNRWLDGANLAIR
jgi:hypothetical protein